MRSREWMNSIIEFESRKIGKADHVRWAQTRLPFGPCSNIGESLEKLESIPCISFRLLHAYSSFGNFNLMRHHSSVGSPHAWKIRPLWMRREVFSSTLVRNAYLQRPSLVKYPVPPFLAAWQLCKVKSVTTAKQRLCLVSLSYHVLVVILRDRPHLTKYVLILAQTQLQHCTPNS